MGREDMKQFIPKKAFFIGPYSKAFKYICDRLTAEQGKEIWLEKTPGHLHYIKYIEKLIKNSKFIHVIRNGTDVVASLYEVTHQHPEQWGGPRDIERCIRRWIRDVVISLQCIQKPRHLLVRYEHLAAEPESVLKDLCRFIGIEYNEILLQDYTLAAKRLTTSDEPWKALIGNGIRRDKGDKFIRIFDQGKQRYIIDRLKDAGLYDLSCWQSNGIKPC